jgi:hypothetical protein
MGQSGIGRFVGGVLAVMVAAAPAAAIDGRFSFETGPDDYASYSFDGGAEVFGLPVALLFDYRADYSDAEQTARDFGIGIEWFPVEWFSGRYRRGTTDASPLEIESDALDVSVNVGRLWSKRLQTRLDVGFEHAGYDPLRRRIGNRLRVLEVPDQYTLSIGLSQDLLDNLTVYGSHDIYEYSEDPQDLARLLLLLRRRPINAIYTLTSFPDEASSIGITWSPWERFSADLSYGITDTVIEQRSQDASLYLNYDLTDSFSLGAGVTYTRTDEVNGPRGRTLIEASEGTYYSLSLGVFY